MVMVTAVWWEWAGLAKYKRDVDTRSGHEFAAPGPDQLADEYQAALAEAGHVQPGWRRVRVGHRDGQLAAAQLQARPAVRTRVVPTVAI
jgi:hypothetical protein